MPHCGSARVCVGASAVSARPRNGLSLSPVSAPRISTIRSAAAGEESMHLHLQDPPRAANSPFFEPQSWKKAAIAIFAAMQVAAPFSDWNFPVANAILYSPDTKVPRTAEVALRRAIPVITPTMKAIQEPLENIFYLLRIPQRKPYGSMESDVKKALKIVMDGKDTIISSIPEEKRATGQELYNTLVDEKAGLPALLASIGEQDADKVSIRLASSLDVIAQIELLQAPALPYLLPAQYQQLPRLTGRALVEMVVKKGDNTAFTVAAGQGPQPQGTIQVVLDGFSAPITAGNFADKVLKGFYNGVKLRTTEQAILSDSAQQDALPMEILPSGEFQPLYKTTLSIQDGELPVLPLSVYGAVAMAHDPSAEDLSSASQFFFYLYDRRSAGLGGLSFEEGQFAVFGYATKGRELLSQLKTGDVIESATLVSGRDRLVYPQAPS
ncbi:peptidyl-prolyl cis-trans isomerase CYP37, chloroplastic isoform X2 [Selaginella moellendorffii]|nr:peptidyl-prolyl cis-trans isomerase CYP37, chloroplastic isoform X2 [Selaginella moellendorffii]|eukprot:XP_002960870.2 peptidyl-prolyl cis-trans isomerase CYP37, chloroplastic isoform X2 [Selaginella moellendorffii]